MRALPRRLRDAYQANADRNPNCPPLDTMWGEQHVADYLGVKPHSVTVYRQRAAANQRNGTPKPGDIPDPDGWVGVNRGPWWWPATIVRWDSERRPGRGVGGGRPWPSNS